MTKPTLTELDNKQVVLIQTFASCADLRVKGHNLDTGMKAFFHVNGSNRGYKIYMTNSGGSSVDCYIKQKGKNKRLVNDKMVGGMSPYKLTKLVDWYFEV